MRVSVRRNNTGAEKRMRRYYKYNPETLMYEATEEPKALRLLRIFLCAVAAFALVFGYYMFYTRVLGWELPKTVFLRKSIVRYESKLEVINRQLDFYDIALSGIEDRDDRVYRSIFGLDSVTVVNMPAGREVGARADSLSKRIVMRLNSLEEVKALARSAGDMASHVPAVPPIYPKIGSYRISSSFGSRIDPVYGGGEFHQGQDFALGTGNPVYATADGVVELADIKFYGYGNEVVIDHGFGYKTRYAHLSVINVTEGMEVKRGDVIGKVGRSGKATGSHLHYEVMYKGKRVNPKGFMDMEMSLDEFDEIIEKRQEQAEYKDDRMPSTMELLRRRR